MNPKHILYLLASLSLVLLAQPAFATTGGASLPWETPLQTVQASLTGPVAISIALIAIAVSGGMLIFGGELNNFARVGVYITLVLGLLVMANNVLTSLYSTGATVPAEYKKPVIQQTTRNTNG